MIDLENAEGRLGQGDLISEKDSTSTIVADPPTPARRPCRACSRRLRLVVPIGSSWGWDLCWRCARSILQDGRRA